MTSPSPVCNLARLCSLRPCDRRHDHTFSVSRGPLMAPTPDASDTLNPSLSCQLIGPHAGQHTQHTPHEPAANLLDCLGAMNSWLIAQWRRRMARAFETPATLPAQTRYVRLIRADWHRVESHSSASGHTCDPNTWTGDLETRSCNRQGATAVTPTLEPDEHRLPISSPSHHRAAQSVAIRRRFVIGPPANGRQQAPTCNVGLVLEA